MSVSDLRFLKFPTTFILSSSSNTNSIDSTFPGLFIVLSLNPFIAFYQWYTQFLTKTQHITIPSLLQSNPVFFASLQKPLISFFEETEVQPIIMAAISTAKPCCPWLLYLKKQQSSGRGSFWIKNSCKFFLHFSKLSTLIYPIKIIFINLVSLVKYKQYRNVIDLCFTFLIIILFKWYYKVHSFKGKLAVLMLNPKK